MSDQPPLDLEAIKAIHIQDVIAGAGNTVYRCRKCCRPTEAFNPDPLQPCDAYRLAEECERLRGSLGYYSDEARQECVDAYRDLKAELQLARERAEKAEAERDALLHTSDKQAVAWKERALKAEAERDSLKTALHDALAQWQDATRDERRAIKERDSAREEGATWKWLAEAAKNELTRVLDQCDRLRADQHEGQP